MGVLIEGVWNSEEDALNEAVEFRRSLSGIRNWITADGSPGPSGATGIAPAGPILDFEQPGARAIPERSE